jgi:hypothetical protein
LRWGKIEGEEEKTSREKRIELLEKRIATPLDYDHFVKYIIPPFKELTRHFVQDKYIERTEMPPGLERVIELTDAGVPVLILSPHFSWLDPIISIVTSGNPSFAMRITAGTNAFNPISRNWLLKHGVIEIPRLDFQEESASYRALKNVLQKTLADLTAEGHSIPIWMATDNGRSKNGEIGVVLQQMGFILKLRKGLGNLHIVPHVLQMSPFPDEFSLQKGVKGRTPSTRVGYKIRGARNALIDMSDIHKAYRHEMYGNRAIVHSTFGEPINISEGSYTKQGLQELVLSHLKKDAVLFDSHLAALFMGRGSHHGAYVAPEVGDEGKIPIPYAVTLLKEIAKEAGHLHSSVGEIDMAAIPRIFSEANTRGVADVRVTTKEISYKVLSRVAAYRAALPLQLMEK